MTPPLYLLNLAELLCLTMVVYFKSSQSGEKDEKYTFEIITINAICKKHDNSSFLFLMN